MVYMMENDGGNNYKIPHMGKDSRRSLLELDSSRQASALILISCSEFKL
jgi:hypothetical protein